MARLISRRGFLGAIIAACAAPAIVRSGLIMPIKPFVYVGTPEIIPLAGGNVFLTPDQITRTALAFLHQQTNFIINNQYDESFASC